MKVQFPRFFRLNPAMVLLWAGLAALFVINIIALQKNRPAHWDKLMMLFAAPFSASRSIDLASFLWRVGKKDEARTLVAAAQSGQVLGAWEQEDQRVAQEYAFWQSVAERRPDYRDAYIQLARLAYLMGSIDEAKEWLKKVSSLDPNSPVIQQLSRLLK